MNAPALWAVTALYGWQMGACALRGQIAQTLIMAGYFMANVGLIMVMQK